MFDFIKFDFQYSQFNLCLINVFNETYFFQKRDSSVKYSLSETKLLFYVKVTFLVLRC